MGRGAEVGVLGNWHAHHRRFSSVEVNHVIYSLPKLFFNRGMLFLQPVLRTEHASRCSAHLNLTEHAKLSPLYLGHGSRIDSHITQALVDGVC